MWMPESAGGGRNAAPSGANASSGSITVEGTCGRVFPLSTPLRSPLLGASSRLVGRRERRLSAKPQGRAGLAGAPRGGWTRTPLCARRAHGTARPVSTALTNGIRVTVSTVYVPSQSAPAAHRYVFAYTIKIANEGSQTAQLRSRHWVITHGSGKVEEVRGPGVVGQQPVLKP